MVFTVDIFMRQKHFSILASRVHEKEYAITPYPQSAI